MRGNTIKPRPEHWGLYEQVPYQEPSLAPRQKLKKLGYILLGATFAALLGPFVPSRQRHYHLTASLAEYTQQLTGSVVVAVFLLALGIYQYLIKPERNRKLGYRLVGRFPVRQKMELLHVTWLEFPPEDTHRVSVDRSVYDTVNQGDVVEVVYSASKDLISVREINSPSATP